MVSQIINCLVCHGEMKRSNMNGVNICDACRLKLFMETVGEITLSVSKKEALIHLTPDLAIKLSWDDLRWLYYKALGLDAPTETLDSEIENQPLKLISVDMPEDILKIERILMLWRQRKLEEDNKKS